MNILKALRLYESLKPAVERFKRAQKGGTMSALLKILLVAAASGAVHGILDALGVSHDSAVGISSQVGAAIAALFVPSPLQQKPGDTKP